MVAQLHKNDYSIARQICKDLRADHKKAIYALYRVERSAKHLL